MNSVISLLLFVALCGQSVRVKTTEQDLEGTGTESLQAGDLFLDRYELISKIQAWPSNLTGFTKLKYLGKGAFGETWLAMDNAKKMEVAVKFFYRQQGRGVLLLNMGNANMNEKHQLRDAGAECDTPTKIMMSKDFPAGQARFAACLENKVTDRKYAHLVLEVAGKKNLEEYVGRRRLSAAVVMRIAKMMLEGLYQMEGSFVHKDIKPANIMIDEDRDGDITVKYIDFGLVGRENTKSGVAGTPMFMPPEVWPVVPRDPVINHKFDIYSAGETLYSLICGKTFHEYIFDRYGHTGERRIAQELASQNPASFCKPGELAPLLDLVVGAMMQADQRRRLPASQLLGDSIFEDIETLKVRKPPVVDEKPVEPTPVKPKPVQPKPVQPKPVRPVVPVIVEDEAPEPTFLDMCHGSKKFWFQNANQCCLREKYDPLRDAICRRPCGPKIAYRNGVCENDCNYGFGGTDEFSKELQCCVAKVWKTKCKYDDHLPRGEGWKWME